MSIQAVFIIVAIVIIRAAALNKLPKTTFLMLWGVVLLRLLVPFSISTGLSVYNAIHYNAVYNDAENSYIADGNTINITADNSKTNVLEFTSETIVPPSDIAMMGAINTLIVQNGISNAPPLCRQENTMSASALHTPT